MKRSLAIFPLRLINVVDAGDRSSGPDDLSLQTRYGESALRAAEAAVQATGKPVKVETAILHGPLESTLIDESRGAALICVGSVGSGRLASRLLGSTALSLGTYAHCPVAIIRSDGEPPSHHQWIAVMVDDDVLNDEVVDQAMEEARLRHAPVLAVGVWRWNLGAMRYDELDYHMSRWCEKYPDVAIHPYAAMAGAGEYLVSHDETIQLLVTGAVDANQLTRLIGPHRPIVEHKECSVLIVRR